MTPASDATPSTGPSSPVAFAIAGAVSSPAHHTVRQPPIRPQPRVVIWLHWLTVLLLVVAFGFVLGRELIEAKATRELLIGVHRWAGLGIWVLAALRIVTRSRTRLVDNAPGDPLWQRALAHLLHAVMYVLLLGLPVLGLLLTNAHGKTVSLPGIGALPVLIDRDLDLADSLGEWHETLAWTLAAIVGAHVAAALWHHVARRDGVLLAMLPGRRARRGSHSL